MAGKETKMRGAAGLAAVLLLGLSACNSGGFLRGPDEYVRNVITTGKWRQAERSADNDVEIISIEHAVAFQGSADALSSAERKNLLDFLRRSQVGGSDRISLHGPLRDFGRHDPVTAARLESLKAELDRLGLESRIAEGGRIAPSDADQIAVLVTRAVAISPDCTQSAPPRGHRPKFLIGCSNTTALGAMVADPLDLREGRPMSPADGEAGALGIQRYREGEIEELEEAETQTTDDL